MHAAELMSRIIRAKYQQLCPECGERMTESDKVCENGVIFVWYRCSRDGCKGQWLQKIRQQPATFGVVANPAYALK